MDDMPEIIKTTSYEKLSSDELQLPQQNLDLADVKLIRKQNNDRLVLECRHPFRPKHVKLDWFIHGSLTWFNNNNNNNKNISEMFYIDRLFRLVIDNVQSERLIEETSNITCLVEDEPRVIYVLGVKSSSQFEHVFSYSAYFIAYTILAFLIIRVVASARLSHSKLRLINSNKIF